MTRLTSGLTGVLPAAGRGTRAYPYTRVIPKAMLDICGQPVLHYTLTRMRDQLGIRDIVIVIGRHSESIREHFGTGEAYGVTIRYVVNDRVELGLAYSVLLAREHVAGEHFVVALSDEFYWNSNHEALLATGFEERAATLAVRAHSSNKEIRKNFGVEVEGTRVVGVKEKPESSPNGLLGCGTYVFHRRLFDVLERRFTQNVARAGDLTAAIGEMIAAGERVEMFELRADYININFQEDIHYARSIVRRGRLSAATVSLVMPGESATGVLEDMLRAARGHARISEVLVVSRKDDGALRQLAEGYGARVVVAPGHARDPYGELFRAGIAAARGDIVVLTKDDDSFDLGDVDKLLAYLCEADLVVGTRTTSQLVQQGSNLQWAARVGNYALAKFIELLWFRQRVRLSDVGCTFRAVWRDVYEQMAGEIRSDGPEFSPEMIVEALRRRLWVIEIPIHYCRSGEETRVRREHRNIGVFLKMAAMIVRKRLG